MYFDIIIVNMWKNVILNISEVEYMIYIKNIYLFNT